MPASTKLLRCTGDDLRNGLGSTGLAEGKGEAATLCCRTPISRTRHSVTAAGSSRGRQQSRGGPAGGQEGSGGGRGAAPGRAASARHAGQPLNIYCVEDAL